VIVVVVLATGLPLDGRGRILCGTDLRVVGFDDVWAAGDNAAVPDLSSNIPGATCSPSAQHAVRQAKVLARNVLRVIAGDPPLEYRHRHVGSVASLGLYKGVAQVYGIKLKGFPAWFMHRTYHLSRVPTFNRKARVVLDWTLALFFRREVVSLGSLHHPSDEFRRAAST
jgi:NADH dehydrogenase